MDSGEAKHTVTSDCIHTPQNDPMAETQTRSSRKRSRSRSKSGDHSNAVANKRPAHKRKEQGRGSNNKSKRFGRQGQKTSHERADDNEEAKRPRLDKRSEPNDGPKPIYSTEFSKTELAEEQRRPKKRVALMIGYCGSGYHGLQIMNDVKTIESEIFTALVAAGAVSKVNADDPKKSQLVRCARTDRGVHAGGNVLSLKMIIEDADVVERINEHLPPQIRIWGVEQVVNSFSAYQQCDSRIYEYLIPTHCFLPPHPQTFLGKKIAELAEEANDLEGYRSRQKDVESFWADTEEKHVKPVLEALDPDIREKAVRNVFAGLQTDSEGNIVSSDQPDAAPTRAVLEKSGDNAVTASNNESQLPNQGTETIAMETEPENASSRYTPLELAVRSIKRAHHTAKLAYRISPSRLARVESTLSRFVGTHAYHNYTVHKKHTDPSRIRHIKSFVAHGKPFIIGDTEWISLKVHGQSFMMHQIRKMVLMACMIVRCGTHEARIQDSFDVPKLIIPRAPALGLLLERPIFEAYNKFGRFKGGNSRGLIEFDSFTKDMDEFKQKEIYERMWKDEAEQQVFANLFSGFDSLRSEQLLWATSLGLDAVCRKIDGGVDLNKTIEEEEVPERGAEEG